MTLNFNSNPYKNSDSSFQKFTESSLYDQNRYTLSFLPKLFIGIFGFLILATTLILASNLGLSVLLPLFGFAKENVSYTPEALINKNEQVNIEIFAQAISLENSSNSNSSSLFSSKDKAKNNTNSQNNILDSDLNKPGVLPNFSTEKAVDLQISLDGKTFYLDENCQILASSECNLWIMDNFSGKTSLLKSNILVSVFAKNPTDFKNYVITFSPQKGNLLEDVNLILFSQVNVVSSSSSKNYNKSVVKSIQIQNNQPITLVRLNISDNFSVKEIRVLDFNQNPEEYKKYSR